ncbi:MAG: hypothetical protein FD146_2587 [Anaerolineaceae bacterium]|nr:MAG: hypothetical protein FD146_2587 [Anaerolineaceae bacterium]
MMDFRKRFWTLILPAVALASACSGLFPAPVTTNTAPAPTGTATPTIVWFPATNTPTPFATPVIFPTGEARPGLGGTLLADIFDDPAVWTTASGAVVDRNRLTLTSRSKNYILSQRNGLNLNDFYAEVDVRLSLCRGADAYGLLFRLMSSADYYRFAVNCSGQARLERVRNGEAVPLSGWLPSGDAPPGAPGEVRLGVWAAGGEMRFFLNDRYQFTVRDPVFRSGTLGVFILPNSAAEETVSFSNLNVYAVTYVSPTPSATPSRTPTPTRTP